MRRAYSIHNGLETSTFFSGTRESVEQTGVTPDFALCPIRILVYFLSTIELSISRESNQQSSRTNRMIKRGDGLQNTIDG